MKTGRTSQKGTLCAECLEWGFCFRYDHEAFRKWHEERFQLNVNKLRDFIPVRRAQGFSFGAVAQKERKAYQNMYDAFHQEDYLMALEYAGFLQEHFREDETCQMCIIFCHYFLEDYRMVQDLILKKIERYVSPYANEILLGMQTDCRNKLRIQLAEAERRGEPHRELKICRATAD